MIAGATLVAGRGEGPVVALAEPLSFWGGFDALSGRVIDRSHPDRGRTLTGAVLLMRSGRGSSSGASVLAEAIRRGTAPAALVTVEPDGIAVAGALVARELYGRTIPIVQVREAAFRALAGAPRIAVEAGADGAALTV
jgi:hypothetical protein